MKLTVEVLKVIRSECDVITLISGHYLALAPSERQYPFLLYTPTSSNPNWSFDKTYDYIRIRFSAFDDSNNKSNILSILSQVEDIFHRTSIPFNHSEAGRMMLMGYKEKERITYLNEDKYWLGTQDYVFIAQKNANEVDYSSSSSQSESSSSSYVENYSSSSSESSELSSSSSSSTSKQFESSSSYVEGWSSSSSTEVTNQSSSSSSSISNSSSSSGSMTSSESDYKYESSSSDSSSSSSSISSD